MFQNLSFFFDNDLEKSGPENIWYSTFLTSQVTLVPGKTDGTQVSSEMIVNPLAPDLCGVQNIW